MLVSNSPSHTQTLLSLNPGGRLCSTPAYFQTTSDEAVNLDSADDWIATQLIPEVDMKITSFARYVTDVGTEGNGTLCVYSNATAPEPNGALNGSDTKAHSDQTDSSTPLTVAATSNDAGGSNDEWKAFDGDDTTYWKSGADPATTAQELEIDFGAGNEKTINKVIIRAANEAGADSRCFPKTFTIQGHNGTSYSTLKTVASSTDPGDQGEQHYTWTNSTPLQKVKINITDNHGTGAFVCVGEIEWIDAQDKDAPGTLLETLSLAAGSGDTADKWTYFDIAPTSQYQLTRNKKYWIVMKGSATKDWSESTCHWNENVGSMFPDSMPQSKYTTNGGGAWSACLQASEPALWNMMINPVEAAAGYPVPQLCYGRYNGKYIYLSGSGMCEIPEAGILLDMSDHNAPDSEFGYHVWLNNSGTLALSATTDSVEDTDGIKRKIGATGYRYLGDAYSNAIHVGHYGPLDVIDKRHILNEYNKIVKTFGKLTPYTGNTNESINANYDSHWQSWNDDDFLCEVLSSCAFYAHVSADIGVYSVAGVSVGFNFGVNGKVPVDGGAALKKSEWNYASTSFNSILPLRKGINRIRPLVNVDGGSSTLLYRYGDNRGVYSKYTGLMRL